MEITIEKEGSDWIVRVLNSFGSTQEFEVCPTYQIALRYKREFKKILKEEK